MSVRQLTSVAKIGTATIPVLSWQCHLTSYGNLCTFDVRTSIKQLKTINYQIFQQQQKNFSLECQIILIDNTEGSSQIVFDGIVDTVNAIWEEDIVEISGRDFSAVLRDQELRLDKFVNQTVTQVIQGIITTANMGVTSNQQLLAKIDSTNQIAGIRASTFQGEDWAMATSPRPTWQIIQQMADEVGFVAYMDTHKTLHFETPAKGQSHTYYWRPASGQGEPVLNLDITQQSRRCMNFTLWVHGYDINGKETIYKEVVRGNGTGHLYHKARHDLTAQNCAQIANNLADEIERKNLTVKLVVDGNTNLNVNDKLVLLEGKSGDLLGMNNQPLFIVGLQHSFNMPDFGSTEGDGFLTHITCNQQGSASTGS